MLKYKHMNLDSILLFFTTGAFDPTHPTLGQVLVANLGLVFALLFFFITLEIGRYLVGIKIFGKQKAYKAIIPVYGLMQLFYAINLKSWLALICYLPIVGLIPFAIFSFLLPKAFATPTSIQILTLLFPWLGFNLIGLDKKYEFQYQKGKNVAFKNEFRTVMPEELSPAVTGDSATSAQNGTLLANASMISRAASAAAEQTRVMLEQQEQAAQLEAMQKKQAEEAAKKAEKHKAEEFKYDIFDSNSKEEKESSVLDFEFRMVNGRFQSAGLQPIPAQPAQPAQTNSVQPIQPAQPAQPVQPNSAQPAQPSSTNLLAIALAFAVSLIFAQNANASNELTQVLNAKISPVISISAPDEVRVSLEPTQLGKFESQEVKVNIFTNAISGYELYFSSYDEDTNLKHVNNAVTRTIPSSFSGELTPATMANNTWGYSLNNTSFKAVPKHSIQAKLKDLKTYPSGADLVQSVYLGVKANSEIPSGVYTKRLVFTALAHENPNNFFSIFRMQDMTSALCDTATTPVRTATTFDTDGSHHGDPNYVPTVTLTDTRDNNTYTVSKLADGKCWMTQNLRIAGKTITPADSNVTTSYTIPASSPSGFIAHDTSNAYVDSDGGLYNWYTATAGTGTQSMSSGNTTNSICPKGWRLPTGGSSGEFQTLYNNYNSLSALRSSPVNLTLSGDVGNSTPYGRGSYGRYWSSTAHSSGNAYLIYLAASNVYPAYNIGTYFGFSVRCVADDKLTFDSIANMQDMTPELCANTKEHQTKTLRDIRNDNTYTVAKLKDGRCWMTQSLRIAGKTLTSADSDVTSNYTIPASSGSGFGTYDTSSVYVDSDGGLYTWYAATAGTGTKALSTQGQNTTVSICPKGWRLPTGGNGGEFEALNNRYSSISDLMANANFVLSGFLGGGSRADQGSGGFYWSSTVNSSDYAYYLYLNTSNAYPAHYSHKYNGFSVRCIAR